MTVGLSVALFGSMFVMRYLPSMPMYSSLSVSVELAPGTGEENHNAELVGQQGVAVTALRPSGRVKIGDSEHEVVSQHGFIEVGTSVKVVSADGMRILVDLVG
jgi:membrane-bound serine protease (ClpP class)